MKLSRLKPDSRKNASLNTYTKGIRIKIITLKLKTIGTIRDFNFLIKSYSSYKKSSYKQTI